MIFDRDMKNFRATVKSAVARDLILLAVLVAAIFLIVSLEDEGFQERIKHYEGWHCR